MKKDELLEQLGESYGYINQLVEKKVDLVKLDVAEKTATTVASVISGVILGVLGILFLIFALITLAFALVDVIGSAWGAFGVVALFLLLLLVLTLVLKNVLITNPTVSKVISSFFPHDGTEV